MNTREFMDYGSDEAQVDTRREGANVAKFKSSSKGKKTFGRRGKSPQQFNGIHRRRSKSIRW